MATKIKIYVSWSSSSDAHHAASEPDATQVRADVVPHPDAAPANALSHGQFQEEQRDPDQ